MRVRHGINAQEFWNGYATNVKAWAITADPRETTVLLKPMGDLLAVVKDGKAQPFVAVQYADQGNTQGLNWRSEQPIGDKSIQDLIDSRFAEPLPLLILVWHRQASFLCVQLWVQVLLSILLRALAVGHDGGVEVGAVGLGLAQNRVFEVGALEAGAA